MQKQNSNFVNTSGSNGASFKNKGEGQNIKVILRVRPPLKSEFGKETAVTCSQNVTDDLHLSFLTKL